MNCLAFPNIVSATGTLTSLSASTDGTGIVLTPDPIIETGTIGLIVDLKASNTNFALGTDNWATSDPVGDNNLAIGNSNMFDIYGNENVALGNANLRVKTAGALSNNVAIGSRVMEVVNGSSSGNVGIGHDIITENFSGNNNIVLGHNMLATDNTVIYDSVAIGSNNMNATVISANDIVIGSGNLQQMGNSNNNIVIGHDNLKSAIIAGNDNIYIGRRLNQNVDDSITNILVGTDIEVATNKRNIIVLGQTITVPAEATDQTTIIGGSHISLGNIPAPTYRLESGQSRCMHNLNQTSNYDFRYMEFLNSGALNMVGVDNNVFNFDLNQLQFPAGPGFRMLTLEIVFTCTYFVEPPGLDPSDVYHSNSCTIGLIYNSQTATWNLMQLQSGYQQPSTNVDCNNNNNQVVFNMAVPYITTIGKFIPYPIVQDQLFLNGAQNHILTYNIQMNTGFANSGLGGYSCMYKFYTSMGID